MISSPKERPIVLFGAGVLGRRIAATFLAGGYTVHIRDPNSAALADAESFIAAQFPSFVAALPKTEATRPSGSLRTFTEIAPAVQGAWLVVEAMPEKLELKKTTFAAIAAAAPADCVLASNSSSYRSRLMVEGLEKDWRERALNMHFTMPPMIRTVELMTDGETKHELFGVLSDVLRECGMMPVTAKRESTGFIFNRLWAAVKREILTILAEDVSTPEEIDLLWENMFQLPTSKPPCRLMDQIGLDTVAFIEDNYIQERGLDGKLTVNWLRENCIQKGKLGQKSEHGGLYTAIEKSRAEEAIFLLDVGLGENNPDISAIPTAGRILKFTPASHSVETLVSGQSLPDGIDISQRTLRMFWTNMGHSTSTHDGSVHSANLDGSGIKTILPSGAVHTPKQLVVDDANQHVYFCDREGMSVHRCNFDGSDHRILVQNGLSVDPEARNDMTRWCVGIAVDSARGYIYWTQKGPSKAGKGRIFRAKTEIPAGETASSRSDIELLLQGLPEPIDLELDRKSQVLYWTDRGEHPVGCSLNRISVVGNEAHPGSKEILARQFHEPIGLKLNADNEIIVADLGGSVYRVGQGKTAILQSQGCYTGVSLQQ